MTCDLNDPQAVSAEPSRRGLPVFRNGDVIGTDARLRELFTLAGLGGWATGQSGPKARHINRARLLKADAGCAA